MSDQYEKFPENTPGKYYVAKVCIGCMICAEIAPENFSENAIDDNHDTVICYVCKQPENSSEDSLCGEAMDICPANAICDDGADG